MSQNRKTRVFAISKRNSMYGFGKYSAECGSSTLEFIFCAPMLVILLFVAQEINERIEHRVTSAIASGNSAWLIDPSKANLGSNPGSEQLAKADVMGTRSNSDPQSLEISNNAVLPDSSVIMSYTETKRHADAYNLKMTTEQSSNSTDRARQRAGTTIGSSNLDSLASGLAGAAAFLSQETRKITNPDSSWIPSVFPFHEIEEHKITWSISETGTTNSAIQAIEGLAASVDKDTTATLQDPKSDSYRILAHQSHYLRRDPSYHPDGYTNGAMFGVILGSGKFNDWVDKCFMKLVVKESDCGEKNGFVSYVRKIYGALVLGKTLIDTAFLSCMGSSWGAGAPLCLPPKLQVIAVELAFNAAIDNVLDKVEKEIQNKIQGEIENAAAKISAGIEASITNATKEIQNKVNSTIDQATTGAHASP